ncbi:hypothetical protein H0264_06440 [Nocardia huaxiensis]|uniref:Uncharacterized protein n=1 Tax=Nocardia huaxiensis TaxID=2755382 RepID=A0A7D6VKH8_9NOCA|nr:hypothetical protein [Nocardia huaxiensis]QLY31936.1 hypothetical protein H0264_06440 [Nocardia huaxiensis]
MMPPRCFVCGVDYRSIEQNPELATGFTLIYFGLNRREEAAQEELNRKGWVGHPDNAVWFCDRHAELGESRKHLHWRAARVAIRAAATWRK